MQFFDFRREDSAAATTKNFDMPGTVFAEQVIHIFKKLNMTSLVGGEGNTLDIFLYCSRYDFPDGSVVPQVDNFGTGALEDSPHDIDRSIMAIEQGGCCNKAYPVFWAERLDRFHTFSVLYRQLQAGAIVHKKGGLKNGLEQFAEHHGRCAPYDAPFDIETGDFLEKQVLAGLDTRDYAIGRVSKYLKSGFENIFDFSRLWDKGRGGLIFENTDERVYMEVAYRNVERGKCAKEFDLG